MCFRIKPTYQIMRDVVELCASVNLLKGFAIKSHGPTTPRTYPKTQSFALDIITLIFLEAKYPIAKSMRKYPIRMEYCSDI